jgi:hypothetical protein
MNVLIKTLAATVLATAAAAGFAADESAYAPARIDTAGPSVAAQVVLAQRYFERSYQMSNGRRLAVTLDDGLLRLNYGRHAALLLRHGSDGRFVSRDGNVVLRFELDAGGDPQHVTLTAPAAWL